LSLRTSEPSGAIQSTIFGQQCYIRPDVEKISFREWLGSNDQNISCKCFYDGTFFETVMPSKVYSAAVVGVDAFEIEIEVHAGWGPEGRISVVGLPDTAVKESKDRVLSALSNSALRRPRSKITINLAPATVRKEGPSFDLPIALAMLQLNEHNRIPELDHCYICGELALSGELRSARNVGGCAGGAQTKQRTADFAA